MGTSVGRVMATDADMGENTDMSYLIKDEEGGELFRVSTDTDTQEAIIIIKKVQYGLLQYIKNKMLGTSENLTHGELLT